MGELETLREELEKTKQLLKKTERQLEKSQSYNEELRKQIETLSTELHGFRNAAQKRQEAACQVEEKDIAEAYGDKPFPVWDQHGTGSSSKDDENQTSGTSIADSLKAAAQEVVWEQAGFVYDSQSGLYYDYNSGYYYDPTQSLYYDPRNGAYFYYDESAREYKFHSYASGQQPQATQPSYQGEGSVSATQTGEAATTETKSASHRKSSKKKDREKPKVQKRKKPKVRRRTKESRQKDKKRARKSTESKIHRECDSVMVDDSDEQDDCAKSAVRRNGVKVKEGAVSEGEEGEVSEDNQRSAKVEVIEIDSSDSLGTGESEMESEPESGELESSSSSSSSESESEMDTETPVQLVQEQEEEIPTESEMSKWPPCIRVVVRKSDVVDVGTFLMVTCTGGTIGREGPKHLIQLPEVNVSKVHAEFKYDYDNKCYTIQDLGSQNGTFVNDLRISETKVQSSAIPLCHGDTLQVASTCMSLHIHPGTTTCDDCEPGQVLAAIRAQQTVFNDHVVLTKEEKQQQVRKGFKQIKKKYGLANVDYVDDGAALKNPAYADKAELRRKFVGSEHPSHIQRDEAPASVHRPISTENKGHRMLAKMGWKEGSGLGKDSTGRAEPVSVEMRANQTAGLGSTSSVSVSLDDVQSARKAQRWAQTQQRYHNLGGGGAAASPGAVRGVQDSGDSQTSGADSNASETSSSNSGTGAGKLQFRWIKGGTQKPP